MDAIKAVPPTWLEKVGVPLAWLPWLPVVLVALVLVVWLFMRVVNRRLTPGYDIGPQLQRGNTAVAIFWGLVIAAMVLVTGMLMGRAAFGAPAHYDAHFRRWAVHYFGARADWRTFKAQGMTESGLDPRVCSSVGACGLMQLMPATAAELHVDPFRPAEAIEGAIRYMRWQWDRWTAPRPPQERLAFAFVGYNAGLGNAVRFQKAARAAGQCDADRYLCVEPFAWKEPREYVRRIARWCLRFGGWGCWPVGGG